MMVNTRKIACDALITIHNGGYSNIVINNYLSQSELDKRDKAFVTNIILGVLEHKITLDRIIARFIKCRVNKLDLLVLQALRIGTYQLLYLDKVPDSAAVNESVNIVKHSDSARYSSFVNGVLRNINREDKNKLFDFSYVENHIARLSYENSISEDIIRCLINSGFDSELINQYFTSVNENHTVSIRINTLKISKEEYIKLLEDKNISFQLSSYVENAIIICNGGDVTNLPGFSEGYFHVQDISSQLCCEVLDAQPGDSVLDVCSAPGGKSFTIAELMNNDGLVKSLDLHESKLSLIINGATRLGIKIIEAGVNDASIDNSDLGLFDKVLCDVPCSGFGVIGSKPEIRYKNVAFLDKLPELQYVILNNASKHVKIGGSLVYSTCTVNKFENSNVVNRFLKEHDEFSICNVLSNVKRNFEYDTDMLTLLPNVNNTNGFFISKLIRNK